MEWLDYCDKHFVQINKILIDAQLALRMRKQSQEYKICCALINYVGELKTTLINYDVMPVSEILSLFGRIYLWCDYYNKVIFDDAVRHQVQLLGQQLRKQVHKNFQRMREAKGIVDDISEFINDLVYLFNPIIVYDFMGLF